MTREHRETRAASRTRGGPLPFLLPAAALLAAALLVPTAVTAQAGHAETAGRSAAAPAAPARHFASDEDLAVMLRYLVEDGATPGIVLGIREADGSARVLYEGEAGPDARPLGPRSAFEIGSINKTFTGTLLADMVARGEVALDDPVQRYLPEGVTVPAWEGREITLLDLATHHSGLPRLAGNHMPGDMANPYADYTVETMYEFLSGHELRREPGTEFEYSNLGMGLLGHALARASGTTYRELLRERILDPLGMEMTGYALEGELAEWMTVGHDADGDPTSFWTGTEAIDGAGGLRSNVEDMLTWLEANLGPPETDLERAMRDAQTPRVRIDEDQSIGLAWLVRDHEGRKLVAHGGGTGGFSTMIAFDPEKEVGFVRLANRGDFPDDLGMDFLRRGPPLDIAEVDVPRATLETYAGRYQVGPDRYIPVRLEDDGYLTMKAGGNVRFRMYPESDSSFFLKRTPWRIRFLRDDAGDVVGFSLEIEGTERRARKVRDETPSAVAESDPGGDGTPDAAAAPEPAPEAGGDRHFPADEDLRLMLRYLVEDGETPGIVVGLLEADGSSRILHHGEAGEGALPLGPESVFELGSITKGFTGILLADMVDRGEVALSDPVSKHLPEGVTVPTWEGREITLLDLATHRSSLPRMPENMVRDDGERYPEYTVEDLYAFLSAHELRREIGSEFEYSNIGFALLGHVLERASGQSYEALLRERILDPLGMEATSTVVDGEVRRRLTRGHEEDGSVAPYRNWPNLPGMGAMRSDAGDMLTFLEAAVGEPETRLERVIRSAREPRAEVSDDVEIGLGWQVRKVGDRRIVGHGGGTAGFSTRVAFDPDLGVGMVRLANTGDFGDDLGMDFVRRGPPLASPEVEVAPEALEAWAGEYELAPGRPLFVRLEPEGWLTVQTPGNVRFRMYAESDSSFFLKRTPWRFTFTRDEAGAPAGAIADFEGTEGRARRVGGPADGGPPPAVVAGNAALDLPLTAEEMAPYAGTYAMELGERTVDLRVFVEDGRLMGQPGEESPSPLLYQGEHVFVPVADIDVRLTFTVEGGRAESLTYREDGREMQGTRKPSADAGRELPPLIDREVFFDDPEIAGVQLSPDGRFITFMRPHRGVRNIWIKHTEEPFDAARPITADTTRPVPGYTWTRDGGRILYIQDKGGNENFHVYAVDPDAEPEAGTGVPPARDLTPYEGVRAALYAAPESTPNHIVVGLNDRDPRYHDVYRLDLRTGERELLYENDENIAGWEVDQQGNLRLAMKLDEEANTRIYRLDGDELVEVYSCSFEETCSPLRFQKDGRRVYMVTNRGASDLSRLVLFDPATGETELVHEDPEGEVDFGGTEWSEATDELEAVYYYGDRARVYALDEGFEKDFAAVRAAIPEGDFFFRSTTADDRLHMVRVSSDVDPGSSYLYDRETGAVELVYRSRPDLPSEHLAPMRPVRYTARDGEEVPAYLTVPKGREAESLPTVVHPHGGPWSRDMWGYDGIVQFLANRGYAVLQPNFRGSTGFGKRWLNLGNGEWGTGSMQHDITDGARWLIEEGIADPERIAIMGGSYGGFATLAGVAFTPDLYAAGVDIVGPSNIITLLNSVPPYWASQRKIFEKRVGDADDPEDRERLERQSPLFAADRIEAPLLVIQGANDPRVKKAESDQMVIALRDRGRTVEYIVAPDEGHGFAGRENRLTMFAQIEKFLAEHLGGRYQESVAPELRDRLAEIRVDPDTLRLVATARLDETVQPLAFEGGALEPGSLSYRQSAEVRGETMEMTVTREVAASPGDEAGWVVVERTETPRGAATDSVWLHRETLVPVRRALHQGPVSLQLEVGADSVLGVIRTPGGERPIEASVDGDVFFEGASLQLAIGTLPLAPGYATSFHTFDFMTGATEGFRLDVADPETVQVGGAAVEALRVEIVPLEGSEGTTTLWMTGTRPHRVLRIETRLPDRMGGGAATAELVRPE